MKKLSIYFLFILPGFAMSQTKSTAPYTATYSSHFVMDDSKYSDKVLSLWKDYEENKFERSENLIADTVSMQLADGRLVKGKESNLAGVKQFRNSIKDLKVTVVAYMATKSVDKNKHWVCIWGDESFTDKDGKTIKARVHEVWGFNKDGKVDYMSQYTGM